MKRAAGLALGLLMGCGVLTASPPVAAQFIDVTPIELDFGNIDIGTSQRLSFRILLTGFQPLTVSSIMFADNAGGLFSLDEFCPNGTALLTGVPPAVTMSLGGPPDVMGVPVGFSPALTGLHEEATRIDSNAEPPDNILFLPLRSVGVVQAAPEPATLALMGLGLTGFGSARRRMDM